MKKNLLLASDSQSCLSALAAGPLRPFDVAGINYSETWQLLLAVAHKCSRIYVHYVPSHVGFERNEATDKAAKLALASFTREQQHFVSPTFAVIIPHLFEHFLTEWKGSLQSNLTHRRHLQSVSPSTLAARTSLPHPLTSLFSRWRSGCVESCGNFAYVLHFTSTSLCHLCAGATESPYHLLASCPGTYDYRFTHHLSLDDIIQDSPHSILRIVHFDQWLRQHLPYAQMPPDFGVSGALHALK